MFQVKEQNKTPEENPKEMVISNLPDIEFKEMIIKMLTKLGKEWRKSMKNIINI